MECDLGRLTIAIDARAEADGRDWRQRFRIAGFEVEEPAPEPQSVEDFNAQVADTMAAWKATFAAKSQRNGTKSLLTPSIAKNEGDTE